MNKYPLIQNYSKSNITRSVVSNIVSSSNNTMKMIANSLAAYDKNMNMEAASRMLATSEATKQRNELLRQHYNSEEMSFEDYSSKLEICKLLHEQNPMFSVDYYMKNFESFMNQALGFDATPSTYWDGINKAVKAGASNIYNGVKVAGFLLDTLGINENSIEYTAKKDKLMDSLSTSMANYRNDLAYEKYNGLIQKMGLATAMQAPQIVLTIGASALSGGVAATAGAARALGSLPMSISMIGNAAETALDAGFDKDTTLALSLGVGLLNTALEYVGDSPIMNSFMERIKPANKSVVNELVIKSVGQLFTTVSKDVIKSMGSEIPTEIMQTAVEMLGYNFALNYEQLNKGKFEDLTGYSAKDFGKAFADTAIETALSTPLMALAPSVATNFAKMYGGEWGQARSASTYTKYENGASTKQASSIINTYSSPKKGFVELKELKKNPIAPLSIINIGNKSYLYNPTDEALSVHNATKKSSKNYVYAKEENFSVFKLYDPETIKNEPVSDLNIALNDAYAILQKRFAKDQSQIVGFSLLNAEKKETKSENNARYIAVGIDGVDEPAVVTLGKGGSTVEFEKEVFGTVIETQQEKKNATPESTKAEEYIEDEEEEEEPELEENKVENVEEVIKEAKEIKESLSELEQDDLSSQEENQPTDEIKSEPNKEKTSEESIPEQKPSTKVKVNLEEARVKKESKKIISRKEKADNVATAKKQFENAVENISEQTGAIIAAPSIDEKTIEEQVKAEEVKDSPIVKSEPVSVEKTEEKTEVKEAPKPELSEEEKIKLEEQNKAQMAIIANNVKNEFKKLFKPMNKIMALDESEVDLFSEAATLVATAFSGIDGTNLYEFMNKVSQGEDFFNFLKAFSAGDEAPIATIGKLARLYINNADKESNAYLEIAKVYTGLKPGSSEKSMNTSMKNFEEDFIEYLISGQLKSRASKLQIIFKKLKATLSALLDEFRLKGTKSLSERKMQLFDRILNEPESLAVKKLDDTIKKASRKKPSSKTIGKQVTEVINSVSKPVSSETGTTTDSNITSDIKEDSKSSSSEEKKEDKKTLIKEEASNKPSDSKKNTDEKKKSSKKKAEEIVDAVEKKPEIELKETYLKDYDSLQKLRARLDAMPDSNSEKKDSLIKSISNMKKRVFDNFDLLSEKYADIANSVPNPYVKTQQEDVAASVPVAEEKKIESVEKATESIESVVENVEEKVEENVKEKIEETKVEEKKAISTIENPNDNALIENKDTTEEPVRYSLSDETYELLTGMDLKKGERATIYSASTKVLSDKKNTALTDLDNWAKRMIARNASENDIKNALQRSLYNNYNLAIKAYKEFVDKNSNSRELFVEAAKRLTNTSKAYQMLTSRSESSISELRDDVGFFNSTQDLLVGPYALENIIETAKEYVNNIPADVLQTKAMNQFAFEFEVDAVETGKIAINLDEVGKEYPDHVKTTSDGYLVFDRKKLAEDIVNSSNGAIGKKTAKLAAAMLCIMPKSTQDALIKVNGGRLVMSEAEAIMGMPRLGVRGMALLEHAKIILNPTSDLSSVLHEAFHLMITYDTEARNNIYSAIRNAFTLKGEDYEELAKFVEKNIPIFAGRSYEMVMEDFELITKESLTGEEGIRLEEAIASLYEAWLRNEKRDSGILGKIGQIFKMIAEKFKEIYKFATGNEFLPESVDIAFQSLFSEKDSKIYHYNGADIAESFDGKVLEIAMNMVGWHGTAYEFKQFMLEKIGTGEGAQAYGWGLYFAQLKEIAKEYAKRITNIHNQYDNEPSQEAIQQWSDLYHSIINIIENNFNSAKMINSIKVRNFLDIVLDELIKDSTIEISELAAQDFVNDAVSYFHNQINRNRNIYDAARKIYERSISEEDVEKIHKLMTSYFSLWNQMPDEFIGSDDTDVLDLQIKIGEILEQLPNYGFVASEEVIFAIDEITNLKNSKSISFEDAVFAIYEKSKFAYKQYIKRAKFAEITQNILVNKIKEKKSSFFSEQKKYDYNLFKVEIPDGPYIDYNTTRFSYSDDKGFKVFDISGKKEYQDAAELINIAYRTNKSFKDYIDVLMIGESFNNAPLIEEFSYLSQGESLLVLVEDLIKNAYGDKASLILEDPDGPKTLSAVLYSIGIKGNTVDAYRRSGGNENHDKNVIIYNDKDVVITQHFKGRDAVFRAQQSIQDNLSDPRLKATSESLQSNIIIEEHKNILGLYNSSFINAMKNSLDNGIAYLESKGLFKNIKNLSDGEQYAIKKTVAEDIYNLANTPSYVAKKLNNYAIKIEENINADLYKIEVDETEGSDFMKLEESKRNAIKKAFKDLNGMKKVVDGLFESVYKKVYDYQRFIDRTSANLVSMGIVGNSFSELASQHKMKGKPIVTITPDMYVSFARTFVDKDGNIILGEDDADGVEWSPLIDMMYIINSDKNKVSVTSRNNDKASDRYKNTSRSVLFSMQSTSTKVKSIIPPIIRQVADHLRSLGEEIDLVKFLESDYTDFLEQLLAEFADREKKYVQKLKKSTIDGKQINTLKDINSAIGKLIKRANENVELKEEILSEANDKINNLISKNTSILEQNKELKNQLNKMQKLVDSLNKKYSENALEELKKERDYYIKLLSELIKKTESEINELTEKIEVLRNTQERPLIEIMLEERNKVLDRISAKDSSEGCEANAVAGIRRISKMMRTKSGNKDKIKFIPFDTFKGPSWNPELYVGLQAELINNGFIARAKDAGININEVEIPLKDGKPMYDENSWVVVKGLKDIGAEPDALQILNKIADEVDEIVKNGQEESLRLKNEREQRVAKYKKIIINSFKNIGKLKNYDAYEYAEWLEKAYHPGSNTQQDRDDMGLFQNVSKDFILMTQQIKKASPALYSYMFGGIVDEDVDGTTKSSYVNSNLNTAANMEAANKTNRLNKFNELIMNAFEIKDKEFLKKAFNIKGAKYSMHRLFSQEKIKLGNLSMSSFECRVADLGKYDSKTKLSLISTERAEFEALSKFKVDTEKSIRTLKNDIKKLNKEITLTELAGDEKLLKKLQKELADMKDDLEYKKSIMTGEGVSIESEYTMQQIMGIYILAQQYGGIKRMTERSTDTVMSNNIGFNNILWVMDQMVNNEEFKPYKTVADGIIADMNSRYDAIAEVYYRINDGQRILKKIDMYFPFISQQNQNAEFTGIAKDINFSLLGTVTNKKVDEGFTKERSLSSIALDLNVVDNYITAMGKQEHYIAFKEITDEMTEMFNSKEFTESIEYAYRGKKGEAQRFTSALHQYMDKIKNTSEAVESTSRLLTWIRSNFAISKLWGNASTVLQQLPTFFLVASKIGWGKAWVGLSSYWNNRNSAEVDALIEKSPQIRERVRYDIAQYQSIDRSDSGIRKTMRKLGIKEGAFEKYDKFIDAGLSFMERADNGVTKAMYYVMYNEMYANKRNLDVYKNMSDAEYETAIINEASQAILDMVPSQNVKDNALIYSSKDNFIKDLLIFTSQLNKQFNMVYGNFYQEEFTMNTLKNALPDIVAVMAVSACACFIGGQMWPADDEEDKWITGISQFLWGTLAETISGIPYVGSYARDLMTGNNYAESSLINEAFIFAKKLGDEDTDLESYITSIVNMTAETLTFTGAPSTALQKVYRTAKAMGEDASLGDLGYLINTNTGKFFGDL